MASTLFAANNTMGGNPNNNPRFMNPNSNPNKSKSKKIKNYSVNGHSHKGHHNDSVIVTQAAAASDDAYSYNQRPSNSTGFNCGGYVSYNVSKCSKSEIIELRRKLSSDLEKIRNLNDRIQGGGIFSNEKSANGKYKKGPNKRPIGSIIGGNETKLMSRGGVGVEFNDEFMKMCKQVLTKLMKQKSSFWFNKPVDVVALGLHDYHQIIKRPMDLGTVKTNLGKGFYVYVNDFANDVRLVFENAMLYNPKTDQVHGMADQLLGMFENLFRPIQAKIDSQARPVERMEVERREVVRRDVVNDVVRVVDDVRVNDVVNDVVNHVNEFSAVDELDGSSSDDIPTPDRSKKMKSSALPVVPAVSNKQSHSTASTPIAPPVVHSPVRMERMERMERVERMERTPSPMQAVETVKPSSTATRVFPKLPKPRAKDPNKREMNMEEKQKLGLGLQSMPPEKMPQLLQIIRKRNDQLAQEGDEIELDIEALDTETLWELDRFVTNWKKLVSKTKRQALLVPSASAFGAAPSLSADIDDVPMGERNDGMKRNKEGGEEDVDIGDEMPESNFPHVEIEKDDGIGGQGQVAGGGGQGNNDNASSSSSGSSSSSSSGSSSSSDSDSGSSSGSDSDADDAQS